MTLALSKTYATTINGTVSFTISPWPLYWWQSGNVLAVTINEKRASAREMTTTLNNAFRLHDEEGSWWWYYTTLQVGTLVTTGATLSANNVFFTTQAKPNVILWLYNPYVIFWTGFATPMSTPKVFINRSPGLGIGYIGRYGDTTQVRVVIPANQKTGTYKWIITYKFARY